MKLLLDQNLSPRLVCLLASAGRTVQHVDDVGMRHESDSKILDFALSGGRVILTQDSDFSTLIAIAGSPGPSVIQLRGIQSATADAIAQLVIDNLPSMQEALEGGAIVTVSKERIRIRPLPIILRGPDERRQDEDANPGYLSGG